MFLSGQNFGSINFDPLIQMVNIFDNIFENYMLYKVKRLFCLSITGMNKSILQGSLEIILDIIIKSIADKSVLRLKQSRELKNDQVGQSSMR